MALWYKLKRMAHRIKDKTKRIASRIKVKTKSTIKKLSDKRPMILRSVFAKNFGTILKSLFIRRERLKPAITKQTQMIAQMRIPKMFREPIYKSFSKFYGVNRKEIEFPLNEYPTFSSFFTRRITRPIPEQHPNSISSPCDGKVLVFEQITGDKCQIIKGARYSLSQLITGETKEHDPAFINSLKYKQTNKLFQLVVYLAPGDYHRFHSPNKMEIINRHPIEGRCDSVSERTIAKGKPIYQKNGRITVTSKYSQGMMTLVMVGALNVMRIHITEQNSLERGDELGYFNLGSTIVMIVEAKDVKQLFVKAGSKVKVGEPLFSFV